MAATTSRDERRLQRALAELRKFERDAGLEPTPRFVAAPGMTKDERFIARCDLVIAGTQRLKSHVRSVA